VHAIANARMTRALRSVSSEKGRDPREFALIAYGGAGPVHAAGLAEELGCRTVLVPVLAGLFSSVGLLFARPEFHDVHACNLDARGVAAADLEAVFAELQARLEPAVDVMEVEWLRSAELRYGGQTWEVEVEVRPLPDGGADVPATIGAFEDEHERLYGVRGEPGSPIVIRALRLTALGPSGAVDRLSLADQPPERPGTRRSAATTRSRRRCARARRSAPRQSRGRCWSTSTTRRWSCGRAGRCGATRRPRR
jgi:N-methylhydantoinase A